ncbi:immunity repressor [Gordonia phage Kuwabara]|nr:immunity repressor [Gordonia phage Kuwabara]
MAPKNTAEFAARIRDAVAASGLTQTQIAKRGGPSDTTLRKIMDGDLVGISAATMKKLDIGLGWTPGSSVRVYQGGQPTVADAEYHERVHEAANVRKRVGDIYDRLEREGRLAQQRNEPVEPDVLDLLMELLGDLPDGGSREKVQQLYDELAIRDFDQLFQRLSRQGKVQVVRHAGRILLLEENGTPISSFFTGSPNDHVIYPTAEEFERNRHDVTKEPPAASSEGEAPEGEKTRGRGSLPDKIRDAGKRITNTRTALIGSDQADSTDDFELVGRDTGGPGEPEQIRRQMDEDAERGDM